MSVSDQFSRASGYHIHLANLRTAECQLGSLVNGVFNHYQQRTMEQDEAAFTAIADLAGQIEFASVSLRDALREQLKESQIAEQQKD